jgi:hypothetical protein
MRRAPNAAERASRRGLGAPVIVAVIVAVIAAVTALGCAAKKAPTNVPLPGARAVESVAGSASAAPAPAASNLGYSFDRQAYGPDGELEQALVALDRGPWGSRIDRRHLVSVPLPDGGRWTHVTFWGATTLAGWRYGDAHHGVVAVVTFPRRTGEPVDSCLERVASWGRGKAEAFDVRFGALARERFGFRLEGQPRMGTVVTFDAERRSIFGGRHYASALAAYGAWDETCLVVGVAIPEIGDGVLARKIRDGFVALALPAITITPRGGRAALEAKTFE